jgi:hypothetical protein
MLYMNDYDIRSARAWAESEGWKVTIGAIEILERLVEWTNSHSDGWGYWRQPGTAARRLMERIQEQERKARSSMPKYDLTYNDRDAALRPIKAFLTRQVTAGVATYADRFWILEGKRPEDVI